jgi:hypothetical protein
MVADPEVPKEVKRKLGWETCVHAVFMNSGLEVLYML